MEKKLRDRLHDIRMNSNGLEALEKLELLCQDLDV